MWTEKYVLYPTISSQKDDVPRRVKTCWLSSKEKIPGEMLNKENHGDSL